MVASVDLTGIGKLVIGSAYFPHDSAIFYIFTLAILLYHFLPQCLSVTWAIFKFLPLYFYRKNCYTVLFFFLYI